MSTKPQHHRTMLVVWSAALVVVTLALAGWLPQ